MQMQTTAVCYKCEGCHRFSDTTFESLASDSDDGIHEIDSVLCW